LTLIFVVGLVFIIIIKKKVVVFD